MKIPISIPITGLLAGAALFAMPPTLSAQQMDERPSGLFDIEARAGVGLPASDLADFVDPGLHLGIGLGKWFHDWVAVRADLDWSSFQGKDAEPENDFDATPGIDLYAVDVGLEFDLLDRLNPDMMWTLRLQGGVGVTFFETEDLGEFPNVDDLSETYTNVFGGIVVGRQVTDQLHVSVQSRAYWNDIREVDMSPLALLRPGNELSDGLHFPVVLGLRWEVGTGGM